MKKFKNSIIFAFILSLVFSTLPFSAVQAAATLEGWGVSIYNIDADVTIDREVTYRGDGAVKIVNRSPYGSNMFLEVNTKVNVEKGKAYKYSFVAKSENAKNVSTIVDWNYATKISLSQFGMTYDWKKFELNYVHMGESGQVLLKVLVEDKGTFWFDDFECYALDGIHKVGNNLIKNSGFDSYDVNNKKYIPYNSTNEKKVAELNKLDSFSAEEIEPYMAAYSVVPTVLNENITIDGNDDDWAGITASKMPVARSQYSMINDVDGYDMSTETKYAYDENNFYIYAEVKDDVHVAQKDAAYWGGDSIQLAMSDGTDNYGTEIGVAYDPESDDTAFYSSFYYDSAGVKVNNVSRIEDPGFAGKSHRDDEEKKTYYELALPWSFFFETMPENILFSMIFSDNDGAGREYVLELTPGIAIGNKTNAHFKNLKMIENSYFWVNGDRSIEVNTEVPFSIFVMNKGESDKFTLNYNGQSEEVMIEKGMGMRKDFTIKIDEMEEYDFDISVESSKGKMEEVLTVNGKASANGVEAYIKKLEGYLKELKELMDECKSRNIPTEYELTAYTVIERWATVYLKEDIKNNFYLPTEYKITALDSIYAEARDNMKDYLAGRKKAFNVPRYVTSDNPMEINGFTLLADTVDSYGNEERRPVHFLGYGHFEEARADIPNYQSFGVNNIQQEIGPDSIISAQPGWWFNFIGGGDGEAKIVEGVAHSGNRCARIVNNTPLKANTFFNLGQYVAIKPNTSYVLKIAVKAEEAKGVQFSWNDGATRYRIDDGTYDWKEYEYTFTSDENRTRAEIWFICEDVTKELFVDDVGLFEAGSDKNLIQNGGFENGYRNEYDEYWINPGGADWVVEMLQEAEDNNIAVSLLISPHYFPGLMYSLYPDMRTQIETGAMTAWTSYILNHEKALQVLGDYLDALLPRVKDFKSLNNICLSNEPGLFTHQHPEFYGPAWVEFLKEKYHNSLDELNDAHNANYTAWEDAKMDNKLGAGASNESVCVYDTLLFAGKMHTEWHTFLANKVKEHIPGMPVHAKAQGTLGLHGGFPGNTGKAASFEDFYTFSDLAGCDYSIEWMGLDNGAHQPLGEELWYDYLAGIGGVPIVNSEDHVSVDGEENFHEQQAMWVENNMWQGAIHYRGLSETWVWRRSFNKANIFYGSLLFRPDCIKAIGDVNHDLNRLSYEVEALINQEADVSILYSRASRQFNPDHMRSVYNAYEASMFNGKKVRVVTEQMIDKANKTKVLIIPNARNVPEITLKGIYDFVQSGGKIIMLGEDCLTKNDINKPHTSDMVAKIKENAWVIPTVSNVADIVSPNQYELADMFEKYFVENNMRRIAIVDAETGERVSDTEWTYTDYNGKTLVNICNFNFNESKTVNLIVDGKVVNSSVNLRNGEALGSTFVIKPSKPMLLSLGTDHPFTDIETHWGESSIASLYGKDMVNGVSENMFAPDAEITRAEFIKMAVEVSGLNSKKYDGSVSDVAKTAWYANYVQTAKENGLLEGLLVDGKLEPEKEITREEMAAVLVRTYEMEKQLNAEKLDFADNADISEAYAEYVSKAVSGGLIYGNDKNEFLPKSTLTRAEAAAVIDRFILK